MNWKCLCSVENANTVYTCPKCGRGKPSYLGLPFEIRGKTNLTSEELAVMYMSIAYEYLNKGKAKEKYYEEEVKKAAGTESGSYAGSSTHGEALKLCQNAFDMLERAKKHNENALLKISNDLEHDYSSLKSSIYFLQGGLYFTKGPGQDTHKSFEAYIKSYELGQSQASLYNIFLLTKRMNIQMEKQDKEIVTSGILFNKTDNSAEITRLKKAAEEIKKEHEIELLKRILLYNPTSEIGMDAFKYLQMDYNIYL